MEAGVPDVAATDMPGVAQAGVAADMPGAFTRLKKTVMWRLAQAAGIHHLSVTMPDTIRQLTHRYMKGLVGATAQARAFSYADPSGAETEAGTSADEAETEAAPVPFVIPAKTFAALVQATGGAPRSKKDVEHLHYRVEAWLVAFLKRVARVAAHREHRVVQPKDVDLVWSLMAPM